MAKTGLLIGAVALAITATLTACSGSHATVQACEKALSAEASNDMLKSMSGQKLNPATEPAACKGLSASDQQKAANEVVANIMGVPATVPSPRKSSGWAKCKTGPITACPLA